MAANKIPASHLNIDDNFSIIINKDIIYNCVEQVFSYLKNKRSFVEVGGYLIGNFQEVPHVELFDIDLDANSTSASIRFSDNYYFLVEDKIKTLSNEKGKEYRILGTWHIHPRSFGVEFSPIDEKYLFLERMLITTDEPYASHPIIHIIFDQDITCVKAYTMVVRPEYILTEQSFISEDINKAIDNEIINQRDIGILLYNSGKVIEYFEAKNIPDDHLKNNDIIGLWKYFPLTVHKCFSFEKIYLENFFQKTNVEEFYFIKIYKSHGNLIKRLYKVKRGLDKNDKNILGFEKVPVQVPGEYKQKHSKIVLQNPDTKETFFIEYIFNITIEKIKSILKKNHNINGEIVCFTYFNKEGQQKYHDYVKGDDNRIILPEGMPFEEINRCIEDDNLPIYFYNNEVGEKKFFEFRTDRFQRTGYNIERIHNSHVFIGGIGLLGNEIAYNLATLGIGKLTILDKGEVDWYNIYRQMLFSSRRYVYHSKVKIAKKELENFGNIEIFDLNSEVPCLSSPQDIEWFTSRIETLEDKIMDVDVVVGAFDTYSARAVLQVLSILHDKVFISSAVDLNEGLISIHYPDENYCYCCGKPEHGSFLDGGRCTLAAIEAQKIISSLTTKVIIDIITNESDKKFNQIIFQRSTMNIEKWKTKGSKKCKICGLKAFKQILVNDKDQKHSWLFNWLYNKEA